MRPFIKILAANSVVVLLVLGIVVTLNLISNRYPVRWDLTEDGEYTLSDNTTKVLKRLEDRLTIKLFYSKALPPILLPIKERVADTIQEFKAHADQDIIVEAIEPDLNEEKEQEAIGLGIVPLELNVIEKDRREVKKAYMGMALYYRDKKQVIPVVARVENLEYLLDLAILKLTQKDLPRIGVYVGTGEERYQLVSQVVQEIGQPVRITPKTKDLAKENLDVLLVIKPKEVDKDFLRQWDELIAAGTNIIIFASQVTVDENLQVAALPSGLDEWLAAKGVGISDRILIDPKQNEQAGFMSGFVRVYMAYAFWVKVFKEQLNDENPITAQIEDLLFPWSNIVTELDHKENKWELTELARSSRFSFLQPEDVPNVDPQYLNKMSETPVMEPLPLSVILTKKDDEKSGQIFLTADAHLLEDRFLSQSQSNAIFLANMIEYSSWGDFLIGVRSRGKTARPLAQLSNGEKSMIKWGLIVGVPLVAILSGVIGLLVLKRRRERFIAGLGG